MRIGVLGTGAVGSAIATRMMQLGHEVAMGSRSADGEALAAWVETAGEDAKGGSFAEAAAGAELIFNCTAGIASLEALEAAGAENLAGKTLVDVAVPLDFSQGMPPRLAFCNDESLGERIQAAHPEARVVKTLNTVNCAVMVDPGKVRGDHVIFVCGDDGAAKAQVSALLVAIGWPADSILDLGGIESARATEMYLPLWLALYGHFGDAEFNIALAR
ncbi:MAG: NAD(P)-binding domain-containing protein [Solirubrobacterales bacterium]|nr:NAD(P)-binding domain-containing protein [Solirubrobacterales bacterium]